ncbi:GNAT family N-acetyltransferase [Thalassotalea ganghwensis]
MDHKQANLSNLIALWQLYGFKSLPIGVKQSVNVNSSWPHRSWFASSSNAGDVLDTLLAEQSRRQAGIICPLWPSLEPSHLALAQKLLNDDWQIGFSQTAMQLPRNAWRQQHRLEQQDISIERVVTKENLAIWKDIASSAFNYAIDEGAIQILLERDDVNVYLAAKEGQYVGTALFFQTGSYLGVHQVAVAPAWQGKGVAYQLMLRLFEQALVSDAEHIVLQASKLGLPLYQKLGFNTLFTIDNYRKSA